MYTICSLMLPSSKVYACGSHTFAILCVFLPTSEETTLEKLKASVELRQFLVEKRIRKRRRGINLGKTAGADKGTIRRAACFRRHDSCKWVTLEARWDEDGQGLISQGVPSMLLSSPVTQ